MQTNFDDVADFHLKFCVPVSQAPALLDQKANDFRVNFLKEELKEYGDAYALNDLEGCADALVDLVYIAMGTAHMMGIPWQKIWDAVQTANMTKRLAKPDGSDSKRGSPLDVVKPLGWVGPDHRPALGYGGTVLVFDATEEMARRCEARSRNVDPFKKEHDRAMQLQMDFQSQTKTTL